MRRDQLANSFRAVCRAMKKSLASADDAAFETNFYELKKSVFHSWPEDGESASESHKETDLLQESIRCWIRETETRIFCETWTWQAVHAELQGWFDRCKVYVDAHLLYVTDTGVRGQVLRETPLVDNWSFNVEAIDTKLPERTAFDVTAMDCDAKEGEDLAPVDQKLEARKHLYKSTPIDAQDSRWIEPREVSANYNYAPSSVEQDRKENVRRWNDKDDSGNIHGYIDAKYRIWKALPNTIGKGDRQQRYLCFAPSCPKKGVVVDA